MGQLNELTLEELYDFKVQIDEESRERRSRGDRAKLSRG